MEFKMKKIFIDTELSIRYGPCYMSDEVSINQDWLSYIIYFDTMILLIADMNTLPTSLIKIEKYPIKEIVDLKVTELPVSDPIETKLRSILFCIENGMIFCATEADSNFEREQLINKAGKHITESILFLKNSFLTIDIIKFITFYQTPIEGKLSESLETVITEYKNSDHISILRNGIDE